MINEKQYISVVDEVLEYLHMNSLAARRLMVGTALVESGLKHIRQLGNGPALGFNQVEPATYDDNYENYLRYRPELAEKFKRIEAGFPTGAEQMVGNMYLSIAHARVKYWRAPAWLPEANDAKAMAEYHKQWYNTLQGATDTKHSVKIFKYAICLVKE